MAGCIEAALGLLTSLGDMFIPAHPFFRSLPRPIHWILQVALGVFVVAAVVAFVIVVGTFSIQFLLYLVDKTIRYFVSLTWGAVTDGFSSTGPLQWGGRARAKENERGGDGGWRAKGTTGRMGFTLGVGGWRESCRVRSSQIGNVTREDQVKEACGVMFNCRVRELLA